MLFIIVVVGSFKLLPHLSYLLSYLHVEYRILGHYLILKDWEFKGIRGITQKKLSESY